MDPSFGAETDEVDFEGFQVPLYRSPDRGEIDGESVGLDPLTRQEAFDIVNLRIGFNFDDANSSLTLWGRNVTDERYYVGSFDAPLQAGRMNSYPAEPATYGITYRKAFD